MAVVVIKAGEKKPRDVKGQFQSHLPARAVVQLISSTDHSVRCNEDTEMGSEPLYSPVLPEMEPKEMTTIKTD